MAGEPTFSDSRLGEPARHAPGLDTLRALAILMVVSFHYPHDGAPEWFESVAHFGWIGVDLFFVLSGFLIGRQLLAPLAVGERPRLGVFCMRRLMRVVPAYWVVLAVYALVPDAREQPNLAPLWSMLTFTQNLNLEGGAFSHAWSLCIEEQFYLATEVGSRFLGRVPGARWLASVTYCLYLSHKLVIHAVHGALAKYELGPYHPVTLLASAACILAVATLLHLGVERPFLRLRERWAHPAPRLAAQA
ncbi:MAG: acyltransferase family protein [Hyalangium sp.]|uniref:acyltransferase family protein n=1 Tax=Hyalangium sp. TaxID=2028555 RepID=UPI00389A1D70